MEIKRGLTVPLNHFAVRYFLVTLIWRDNGSIKWYPYADDYDHNLTSGIHESKYRIGVREVEVKGTVGKKLSTSKELNK